MDRHDCARFASQNRTRWSLQTRSPTFRRAVLCALAFIGLILAHAIPSAHADDIAYQYDELGRLVQATNATSGEAVLYSYDAAGNITSQRTVPLSTLSIGHFSPAQGPVGTHVTINGTGFSTVPAANGIRFNGVSGAVASATTTQIVAIVPAGATTGTISVEVAASTVTSDRSFTVTSGTDEPTITLVTPNIGNAGTRITLVGSNFETDPTRNNVRLNATSALVTASSSMTVSAVIPASAGSGRIRLTTPRGTALSPSDFIVVPPNYGSGQIVSTGRMEADGTPVALSFPSASKINLRMFEGKVGDLLTVGVTSTTFSSLVVKVFGPNAAQVASGTVTSAGQGLQIPKLAMSGTYTVVVDGGGSSGNASIGIFRPLTDTITVGGTSSTLSLTPTGRRGLVTFSGNQGDYVNLTLSGVTLSAGTVTLTSPTGARVVWSSFTTAGAVLQPRLPRTGTYVVLIDPSGSVGGSVTVSVASTSAASLTPNAGTISLTLSSSSPVTHTFRAEAGQYMALGAKVIGPVNFAASFTVRNPDGTLLATKTPSAGYPGTPNWSGAKVVNFGPLPYSGTYTVVVQRTGSTTGTAQVTLTSAATGMLTANGATVDVPITLPGQSVVHSFNASAGEFVSYAVGERTGFIPGETVTVIHPDGSVLTSSTFSPPLGDGGVIGGGNVYRDGGKVVNLGPMPVSGTYKVVLQQVDNTRVEDDYTGTLKVTLSNPLAGTINVDGTTASASITAVGQGLKYTFQGTSGQYLAVGMSSNAGTITAANAVVLDPAGAAIASGSMTVTTTTGGSIVTTFGSTVVNTGPLASSGTYTVLVLQAGSKALSAGNIDLTLSTPLAVSIVSNGTPSSVNIDRPGQGVMYTFSGAASDYLAFHASVHGMITAGSLKALTTSGVSLATGALTTTPFSAIGEGIGGYDGKAVLNVGPLAATTTYSILFQQTGSGASNTGPVTATLSTPITGSFAAGSSTSSIDITQPGRGVLYTFNASTGDYRSLYLSEPAGLVTSAAVTVLSSQGATIATGTLTTAASGSPPNVTYAGRMLLNIGPLPNTGMYSVLLQQTGNGAGETGGVALTLSEPATGTLAIGTPATATVGWPGQSVLYDFLGNDGQLLSLQVSEAAGSYISDASVKVLNPGGSKLKSATLNATVCPTCGNSYSGSVTLTSGSLPGAGTYRVLVQQTTVLSASSSVGTGELTLALNNLAPNGGSSTNVSTSTPGQRAIVNFTASAGESVGIAVTGMALTPAAPIGYTLYLYQPSGVQLNSAGCATTNSGCELTARNLPATGTYRVEIAAGASQTISGTVTVSSAFRASLTAGTPYNMSLSTVGQPAELSFIAAAGETLSLNLAGLSTTPAGVSTVATVFNSSGDAVAGTTAIGSGLTFNMPTLPAGNYSVWITSQYPATSSMQVTLQPRQGGAPADGVSTTFSAPANGQYAYFDFSGTAGEAVSVALTNVSLAPSSPSSYMFYVIKPDGLALNWNSCVAGGAGCIIHTRKLPMTGTYRVEVRPNGYNAISGTITITRPATGTLSASVPYNLSTSAMGQPAALTFQVDAGDTVALNISSLVTTPANTTVVVSLFDPAGNQLSAGGSIVASGMTMNLTNLAGGIYTVWITPQTPATSSMQITLHPGIGGPIEEGVPTSFSIPARGQSAYFRISGTAGEAIGVALTNTVLTPTTPTQHLLYLVQPDGQVLTWTNCWSTSPGCELAHRALPLSGTYLIEVRPNGFNAISSTITVTKGVRQYLSTSTPLNLSLSPVGRPALLTFSAVPSQTFAIEVAGTSTVPSNTAMSMTVFDQNGTQIGTSVSLSASTSTLNLPYLSTGAYSVWIVPQFPATSTLQVTLHPQAGGLLQDGVPLSFSAAAPLQNAYFEFDAVAGDSIGAALTGVSFNPSNNPQFMLYLYQPNGAQLNWTNCSASTGCAVRHRSLPVSGRYRIEADVHPNWSTRISGTLTASKGLTGTLIAGTPQTINLTPTGRPALLTFTLPSAQVVSMVFSGISTTPAGGTLAAEIFSSAGTTLASGSSTAGFTLTTATLSAGTYKVWIYPSTPLTSSVTVSY
jgi:YD repeat-containing protein